MSMTDSHMSVFIMKEEFYDLYKSGQESRIIDLLNRLKMSPFADFGESAV
jgi:hypothetical protein